MNLFEATFLGLVQGLTEFIPVSSSGHLILAREFLGVSPVDALAFDAVLQLATVLAVAVYFLREVPQILRDRTLLLALVLGTIPAVVVGLLLEGKMDTIFRNVHLVAWMLLLGAGVMWVAEWLAKQDKKVGVGRGLVIGLFQAFALVPGMSRSGATISGGLFAGLTRESATRFSFLLSVPIIAGSGLKGLAELSTAGITLGLGLPLLVASIVAFASGLWAVSFLIKYLKTHKLTLFIWYRVVLAVLILLFV